MIEFPITDLLDDAECLARTSSPSQGLVCPHCGSLKRRLFRRQRIPAYRCRARYGYYTIVTGTVFEKTRQRPST